MNFRFFKEYVNEFGIKIPVSKILYHFSYKGDYKCTKFISRLNEELIKKKLRDTVTKNINNPLPTIQTINKSVPYNSVIWIMWWQGKKKTPKIVETCISKIKHLNNNRKVILITKYNYKNYIKLDSNILNKVEKGKITITHLSDIIRVNLLYVYGGVWIDSTVFETSPLPKSLFSQDFFSIKTGKYTYDPSHGMWTTFFMEAKRNSKLMGYLVAAFNRYCLMYDEWIDYILFDYFIRIIYEDSEEIKKQIERVPINNQEVFELKKHLNERAECSYLEDSDTYLFKLSYKESLREMTKEGRETLYANILNS